MNLTLIQHFLPSFLFTFQFRQFTQRYPLYHPPLSVSVQDPAHGWIQSYLLIRRGHWFQEALPPPPCCVQIPKSTGAQVPCIKWHKSQTPVSSDLASAGPEG